MYLHIFEDGELATSVLKPGKADLAAIGAGVHCIVVYRNGSLFELDEKGREHELPSAKYDQGGQYHTPR